MKKISFNFLRLKMYLAVSVFACLIAGCVGGKPNEGKVEIYRVPNIEAQWIRNGEPIEFEEKLWYPIDILENLLDSEVYFMGEYKGIQFFVDKSDVQPYQNLYTKFSRNRYRAFEAREKND